MVSCMHSACERHFKTSSASVPATYPHAPIVQQLLINVHHFKYLKQLWQRLCASILTVIMIKIYFKLLCFQRSHTLCVIKGFFSSYCWGTCNILQRMTNLLKWHQAQNCCKVHKTQFIFRSYQECIQCFFVKWQKNSSIW